MGHPPHLCLSNTSCKVISEPYRVSFQCFRVPKELNVSPATGKKKKCRRDELKAQAHLHFKSATSKKRLTVVRDVEAVLAYSFLPPAPDSRESPVCESSFISVSKKKIFFLNYTNAFRVEIMFCGIPGVLTTLFSAYKHKTAMFKRKKKKSLKKQSVSFQVC